MSDRHANGNRNSPSNWLLGAGVFLVAASAGFLLLFGVVVRAPAKFSGWQAGVSVMGLLVGGIMTAIALSKRTGRSTIVPALVSLACAVLLTGGAGYGYLATCNYDGPKNPANGTFFVLAAIGAIFCAVTAVWLVVAIIVRIFKKRPEQETK